jgi:hypothetical protein
VDVRRIIGMALFALVFVETSPATAQFTPTAATQGRSAAVDPIVRGRIVEASSEPLPQQPGTVFLVSLWTYRIHVVRVIHGHERREEIVARETSDPALRKDVDLLFDLSRSANDTFRVIALKRA